MGTLNDIISGLKWGKLDAVEAHDRIVALFKDSVPLCNECGGLANGEPVFCSTTCLEKFYDAKLSDNMS